MVLETRARGHSVNAGDWQLEADFSAIGIAPHCSTGVIGALNLVLPKSAMRTQDVRRRWLPALRALADDLGAAIDEQAAFA